MGVGSVTSMNSMSSMRMTATGSIDVKSKNIEKEITDIQQQMQKISSKEELSVVEKADERKKQKKELSSLNAELKRQQEEFLRSQKREIMMAELQKDKEPAEEKSADGIRSDGTNPKDITDKETKTVGSNMKAERSKEEMSAAAPADLSKQQAGPQRAVIFKSRDGIVVLKDAMNQDEKRGVDADEKQTDKTKEDIAGREKKSIDDDEDKDTGLSRKEIYEIVSADAAAQKTSDQESAIAGIQSDIAVLKGEINQDEKRDINTDKKQAELEKLEKKEERARTIQSLDSGEANSTTGSKAKVKVSGTEVNTENNVFMNGFNLSKEEAEASQPMFNVSLGN